MVFYLYIVDGRGHLVGVTSLRRLLLVSPETPLKRIMTADPISARVDMDQEEVARLVASYNLLAIPVVDEHNKLVGVITVDDVIDVIKDEATEDLYRLAGVSSDERVFTPASESLRKRMPWLIVNLATAFLAAAVVGVFQATIASWVALAVFMPIVAGMGGNAATQTLTVIIRGIALGELTWGNSRKALVKNLLVGVGNGVVAGRDCCRRRMGDERRLRLGVILAHGDGHQSVRGRARWHAHSAGAEGVEDRSGAGLGRVHHHLYRRLWICIVPRTGHPVHAVLPTRRVE